MKRIHLLSISLLLSAPLFAAENRDRELARLTALRASRDASLLDTRQTKKIVKESLEKERRVCKELDEKITRYDKDIKQDKQEIRYNENILRTLRAKVAAREKNKKRAQISRVASEKQKEATKDELRALNREELAKIQACNSVRTERNKVKNPGMISYFTGINSDTLLPEVVSDVEESDTEEPKAQTEKTEKSTPSIIEEPIKKAVVRSCPTSPVVSDIEEKEEEKEIATDDEVSSSESEDETIPSIDDLPGIVGKSSYAYALAKRN